MDVLVLWVLTRLRTRVGPSRHGLSKVSVVHWWRVWHVGISIWHWLRMAYLLLMRWNQTRALATDIVPRSWAGACGRLRCMLTLMKWSNTITDWRRSRRPMPGVLERRLVRELRWNTLLMSYLIFWRRGSHIIIIIPLHGAFEICRAFMFMSSAICMILWMISTPIRSSTKTTPELT